MRIRRRSVSHCIPKDTYHPFVSADVRACVHRRHTAGVFAGPRQIVFCFCSVCVFCRYLPFHLPQSESKGIEQRNRAKESSIVCGPAVSFCFFFFLINDLDRESVGHKRPRCGASPDVVRSIRLHFLIAPGKYSQISIRLSAAIFVFTSWWNGTV